MKYLFFAFLAFSINAAEFPFPRYRSIKGQTYDVALSLKWTTINLNSGYIWSAGLAQVRPSKGQQTTLSGRKSGNGIPRMTITIENFLYDPANFTFDKTGQSIRPRQIPYRVFLIDAVTNYTSDGKPLQIATKYDFGTPVK